MTIDKVNWSALFRNKSKGDVDLKELPVRPGRKPKLEAERYYRCMCKKARFRTTKAAMHWLGALLFAM
jgi:hypothetical protein